LFGGNVYTLNGSDIIVVENIEMGGASG